MDVAYIKVEEFVCWWLSLAGIEYMEDTAYFEFGEEWSTLQWDGYHGFVEKLQLSNNNWKNILSKYFEYKLFRREIKKIIQGKRHHLAGRYITVEVWPEQVGTGIFVDNE